LLDLNAMMMPNIATSTSPVTPAPIPSPMPTTANNFPTQELNAAYETKPVHHDVSGARKITSVIILILLII
jgi:hypothetical protein